MDDRLQRVRSLGIRAFISIALPSPLSQVFTASDFFLSAARILAEDPAGRDVSSPNRLLDIMSELDRREARNLVRAELERVSEGGAIDPDLENRVVDAWAAVISQHRSSPRPHGQLIFHPASPPPREPDTSQLDGLSGHDLRQAYALLLDAGCHDVIVSHWRRAGDYALYDDLDREERFYLNAYCALAAVRHHGRRTALVDSYCGLAEHYYNPDSSREAELIAEITGLYQDLSGFA
jgi:hypothetical protein